MSTVTQSRRKFISSKEAAGLLEVNISTIARWCRNTDKTKIPVQFFGGRVIKIPRKQFYKWANIDDWKDD